MTHKYLLLRNSNNYPGKLLVGESATTSSSNGCGLIDKTVTVVNIPSSYKGVEIAEIGHRAFDSTNIVSVFIPKTIVCINMEAFECCYHLVEFRIEKGSRLQKLGRFVFYRSTSLKRIDFPASITSIATGSAFLFFDDISLECFSYAGTQDFSSLSYFFESVKTVYVTNDYKGTRFAGMPITRGNKTCGVSQKRLINKGTTIAYYIYRINTLALSVMIFLISS